MKGGTARRLLAAVAALLAAGCGGSGGAPQVAVRWDQATYVLAAANGCTCAWIIATVDGQIGWPDRVDPLDAGVPGGPTLTSPGPGPLVCSIGKVNPIEALQAEVVRFCGQGVAGSWRFRATVAAAGASAYADATVVVP